MLKVDEPTLYEGFNYVDDRGILSGCNAIDMSQLKRFYVIENHESRFVRAWHGHRFETKVFYCLSGAFLIGTVKIEDFKKPDSKSKAKLFTLSSIRPQILVVPGGYANGLMNLTEDSKLMVISDRSLEESAKDDYRYKFDYWNVWGRDFR